MREEVGSLQGWEANLLTPHISPQSLEKMNIEQKMSIRILK